MRKLIIPISLIIVGLLAIGIFSYLTAPKKPTPVYQAPAPIKTYPTPPEVLKVSQELGLDQNIISQIEFTLGSAGPCTAPGYWGCYKYNHIWLTEVKPHYLAHEYLHHVKNPKLNLRPIYDSNPLLRQGMRNYTPEEINTELFPVICTQVADYKLPADVLAECTKLVPNRNILPSDY